MESSKILRLYKATLDPLFFATRDSSLAIVAKISREFEEELEEVFVLDNLSRKLIRTGIINVTIDTKQQRDAYLISNFGVETTCADLVPYDGIEGDELLDMLSNAKEELAHFQPPTPTLRCSYKEYEKISRKRSVVKVKNRIDHS